LLSRNLHRTPLRQARHRLLAAEIGAQVALRHILEDQSLAARVAVHFEEAGVILREALVDARLEGEVIDGALVGGIGVDVFADEAAGEEVDEGGFAAVDDVHAGSADGGVLGGVLGGREGEGLG
jgi:hypothetical protein